MTEISTDPNVSLTFPDHTQLPESDGTFVKNFQEHPQSLLLTDSIGLILQQLHPDGQYAIGQDCGIYWRETNPPEQGAIAPDWFYVPNVPPRLGDKIRRSYVYWRELMVPLIVLEFATPLAPPYRREDKEKYLLNEGLEERDKTPLFTSSGEVQKPGKFWVYERILRIPYYGIFEINRNQLEVYHLVDFTYQQMEANERNHYPIPPLGVELGLWNGTYQNQTQSCLRWWDLDGNLLLIGQELAEKERQRAELAEQKAAQLAERLREMGIEPEALE
ncbi:MAG: Uma2 family endonuclease [Lyngbya sp.]|nr:Uma2 family endonuclease [Lyngbya sp.]